jgi:hypothetical protein
MLNFYVICSDTEASIDDYVYEMTLKQLLFTLSEISSDFSVKYNVHTQHNLVHVFPHETHRYC